MTENIVGLSIVTDNKNGKLNTEGSVPFVGISPVLPYGMIYSIPKGEKAITIPIGNTAACLGVLKPNENLEVGEVMLYSAGGASIILKNDGSVLINGRSI